MKKLHLTERIMGFIIAMCSIVNLIYCFIDAPSGISRIDLLTICLIRQSLIFIPLFIICIIDFVRWCIKVWKEESEMNTDE